MTALLRPVAEEDGPESLIQTRFDAALEAVGPFERRPRLAIALSGGADSRALLLLASAWAAKRGGDAAAFIVDHGLRAGSAVEAADAASWCKALGIEARLLPVTVAPGNLQQEARQARYAALLAACRETRRLHLLLGHHAADRRDTLLMRLIAGAGPAGLAGMRDVDHRPEARLLRPLLTFEPNELRRWLVSRNTSWCDDPSNSDPRFSRVRLRPVAATMQEAGWSAERLDRQHRRLAAAADDERRQLAHFLARSARFEAHGFVSWRSADFDRLDAGLQSRLLMRLLRTIRGDGRSRSEEIERLIDRLAAGRTSATLHGCRLVRDRGRDHLCREPVEPAEPLMPGRWDRRFEIAADDPAASIGYAGERWPDVRRRFAEVGYKPAWPAAVWSSLALIQRLDESPDTLHIVGITRGEGSGAPARFRPAESAC